VKFTCPRCLEESVGREYHAACFEAIAREQEVIRDAMALRREEARVRRKIAVSKAKDLARKEMRPVDRMTSLGMMFFALEKSEAKFIDALRASGERFTDALVPKERVWRITA